MRVTAEAVLDLVAHLHGVAIDLEGRCPGGEVGAYYGRTADGRRIVFKWWERPETEPRLRALVRALSRLHADGYPLPSY
jgi:hypothetical protein